MRNSSLGVVIYTYNPSTQETGRSHKFKASLSYAMILHLKKELQRILTPKVMVLEGRLWELVGS